MPKFPCARPALLAGLAVLTVLAAAGPAAAAKKLDPESEKFYRTARLIMTKEEDRIFKRIPDPAGRQEFIADFWLKRDPDPDTALNEYRQEFEARIEFVSKRFNKEGGPGFNTDRGRVYIFMGPPDKIEEFPPQTRSSALGFTYWWSYYDDHLAIEFTDEKGSGRFRITDYSGDFFEAMDLMKMGRYVRVDDVFSKKVFKFETTYDAGRQELKVRIPAKSLMFKENDAGAFQVDLRFRFYIYGDDGAAKESFLEARSTVLALAELDALKTAEYVFARPLKPGTNYVDVIIQGPEGTRGKIRQMFEIKVPRPRS